MPVMIINSVVEIYSKGGVLKLKKRCLAPKKKSASDCRSKKR